MILTTKISRDSQAENTITTLDKFFQFIIIDKIDANRCKVSIYNAISFSGTGDNSKLIIDFHNQHHSQIQGVKYTDCERFYQETDILKQFWGSDSKFSADISSTIEQFFHSLSPDDKKEIVEVLGACNSSGIFGVSEKKESIKDIIINPSSAEFVGSQAKLSCNIPKAESKFDIISNGYWFKAEFETDLSTGPNGFNIESKLEFSKNSQFKSPDFKIYIQKLFNYLIFNFIMRVLVFGSFDLVHPGHHYLFKEARKLGDELFVVVAKDATIRKVKGNEPRFNENERLKHVQEIHYVDKAVLGNLRDQFLVIEEHLPNYICLGYDQESFITQKLEEELKKQ